MATPLAALRAPLIGLGLALIPLLNDPAGKAVAVRDASGALRVSGSRAGSYTIDQLFEEERGAPPNAAALRENVRCDPQACLLNAASGFAVAHVLDPAAMAEECRRSTIVVTPLKAPEDCAAPLVVDALRLARFGSHAIRLESGGREPAFEITTERSDFPRPWQAGASHSAEVSISAAGS